jgi:hypothetical protein
LPVAAELGRLASRVRLGRADPHRRSGCAGTERLCHPPTGLLLRGIQNFGQLLEFAAGASAHSALESAALVDARLNQSTPRCLYLGNLVAYLRLQAGVGRCQSRCCCYRLAKANAGCRTGIVNE